MAHLPYTQKVSTMEINVIFCNSKLNMSSVDFPLTGGKTDRPIIKGEGLGGIPTAKNLDINFTVILALYITYMIVIQRFYHNKHEYCIKISKF